MLVAGRPVDVAVTVGCALAGPGPVPADQLVADADREMYDQKRLATVG